MSERLFDELARALANPLPRRGALRVLGVALAAAWLGPARASAAPAGSDVDCTDMKICSQGTETCFTVCCPPDRTCCLGPALNETGCPTNPHCCHPTSRCNPDGSCTPGSDVCDDGRPPCDDGTCCPPGEECVDGQCGCPRGSRRCGVACCPTRWECVGDGLCCPPNGYACGGACCTQYDLCVKGRCVPRCERGRSPCGPGRCCPRGQRCVDARRGRCEGCPPGRAACGGRCCDAGAYCCDPHLGLCCDRDSSCSRPIEGKRHCCRTQWCETASGGRCCPEGTRCLPPWDGGIRRDDPRVCCPPGRQTGYSGQAIACCPAGTVSLGDNLVVGGGALGLCCPEEQLCAGPSRRTCCPKSPVDGRIAACCAGRCCSGLEVCCEGSCCDGTCCGGACCPTGRTCCPSPGEPSGTACVDPLADPRNCGGCGVACASGRCAEGVCA